ncbi:hypothetical protein JTE90_008732 [Oedothorax gibbosus]|uniref:Uncharacterized protein n=1 Tax=Oedothorax gibbosus TaxID=931172 RepID=A0AAV6UP27_9ARAC|nr:hypothetical protein JTE90_008732 [Oedothorax gibbosus]
MAFRFFQWIRREFILRPLVTSKSSFATVENEPTESLLIGKEPKLTKKEKRLKMFLQAVGVFLPSVYLGHVLSNHDIFGPSVKEKKRKRIAEEEREKALEKEEEKEEMQEKKEEDGQSKNEKKASGEEEKSKDSKDNKEKAEQGDGDSKNKEKEDGNDKGNKKEAKDSNAGENDAK